MFSFIWHLKGAVPLQNRLTNEAALDRVEWLLDKQLLFHRKREADLLMFNEPFLKNPFGPNWLAIVIYDQGRFWIEQRKDSRQLRYDLRSLHGMVFCMPFCIHFLRLWFGARWSGKRCQICSGGICMALWSEPVPGTCPRAAGHREGSPGELTIDRPNAYERLASQPIPPAYRPPQP